MSDSEIRGPFRRTSSEVVYRNPWIHVREDRVVRPGGSPGLFGVVEMRPGVTVLALGEGGEVHLAREYKYAIEAYSMELISGAMDDGEAPLETGRRELREEAGLEATDWTDLGTVDPFTTVIRSPNRMFLARGLRAVETAADEDEPLDVHRVSWDEAVAMVLDGRITHAASCVAILKAKLHLDAETGAGPGGRTA